MMWVCNWICGSIGAVASKQRFGAEPKVPLKSSKTKKMLRNANEKRMLVAQEKDDKTDEDESKKLTPEELIKNCMKDLSKENQNVRLKWIKNETRYIFFSQADPFHLLQISNQFGQMDCHWKTYKEFYSWAQLPDME